MAHTLLSRVALLAAASRRAGELGIDVPELLGRRAETPAASAARTGAEPAPAGRSARAQPAIAVVGAGLSGLTAATSLRDAGFDDVTVYEASDRVGGRTFTHSGFWGPGRVTEWGAELVDSSHATIFGLCRRYGLATVDTAAAPFTTDGAEETLFFDGGYYPWEAMLADWAAGGLDGKLVADVGALPPYPWAFDDERWTSAGRAIDELTVREWIETRIPGGHSSRLGRFVDVAYLTEYGEETDRQGAAGLLALLGFPAAEDWWVFGASDERWRIEGGTQQIALAQADELGASRIRLGWALGALSRDGDGGVTATFDEGGTTRTVRADRIVLAIPLGAMKAILADGGFAAAFGDDARRVGAIEAMGMGANTKLHVELSDRFWTQPGPWGSSTGGSFADTGYQIAWHATAGQPGPTGVLANYTGGDLARSFDPPKPWSDTGDPSPAARALVEGAARAFLERIEPVFPGATARWTGKASLAAWHASPFQRGSYGFWTPGYLHRFAGCEAAAAGPIHFAGEHVSSSHQGYMEGAAAEGARAAREIAAAYR